MKEVKVVQVSSRGEKKMPTSTFKVLQLLFSRCSKLLHPRRNSSSAEFSNYRTKICPDVVSDLSHRFHLGAELLNLSRACQ